MKMLTNETAITFESLERQESGLDPALTEINRQICVNLEKED